MEIDKGNGKKRPLGIASIEDRLIQQCILQVLEPICEAKFHDRSNGFRPNRGVENALAQAEKLIQSNKLYIVVDIDIKGFFDNVSHGKLLKQLWTIRKIPKSCGGDDKYNNLIIVHTEMERLIKSQDKKEINRILNKYKLECNQRRKVNTIRKNAGLEEIDVKALDKEL